MQPRTKRTITAVIATILLLIASHQLLQTWAAMRDRVHTNDPAARKRPAVVTNMAPEGMRDFFQMLDLTADQRPRVEAIVTSARAKLGTIRNNTVLSQQEKQAKSRALMAETLAKIKSVLRPDQWQKLEQFHQMQAHGVDKHSNDNRE